MKNPNLGDNRKTERFTIRLRPSELIWLKHEAQQAGIAPSKFLRDVLRDYREVKRGQNEQQ